MNKLLERLAEPGILVSDGATGTQLQKECLPPGIPAELCVLQMPEKVGKLHRAYINAGSEVILTNSFSGSRIGLKKCKLSEKVFDINLKAAQLARDNAGERIIVLGDIGPTGELFAPFGSLRYEDAVTSFSEQAAGLIAGGVDAILIETMSDLREAKAAVEGVRKVTNLPLLVTMSFDTRGRTSMGVKPASAAKELWGMGISGIGANCGNTLTETFNALHAMRQAVPQAVLIAKPNAGLPYISGGKATYDVTPGVMAAHARRFKKLGIKMFGGCCGTEPEHIKAVAAVLHSR